MKSIAKDLAQRNIAVVILFYRVEAKIGALIVNLPRFLKYIVIVDDASPDNTASIIIQAAKKDRRIILLRHKNNQGVGGAMLTGFRTTLELEAGIVVKIDGDRPMEPTHLTNLLLPIIQGRADYTKGEPF